ncbi:hypothetical protein L6452_03066 [Arctium lappa]|uniref:Uncharacterized protein n=1 Tax=Arctium lappa TaxID=4217 RepID=A0ACB9FM60_ARCLA|nr:hypothetical protein L6452_03066 [Arctium lappa]
MKAESKTPKVCRGFILLSELKHLLKNHNNKPLHHAARGEHKEIVELLLSIGASPFMTNVYGKTPGQLVEANTEVWTILEAAIRASAMASWA